MNRAEHLFDAPAKSSCGVRKAGAPHPLIVYLARHEIDRLPWLNRAPRPALFLTARQHCRIARIYAGDFALIESLRRQKHEREAAIAAKIAAE